MKVITKGRQEGKTNDLVELSAKLEIPILCESSIKREIVKKMAGKKNLEIPEPLCIDCRSTGFRERLSRYDSIIVDDADLLLQKILGVKITALSVTTKEDKKL